MSAVQRLLQDGVRSPSVDEVAAAADVSRRTIYMHFPTLDQLLLDAAVGLLSSDGVEEAVRTAGDDPVERVEALVRAVLSQAEQTLPLGRAILRLTVEEVGVRRGFRRVAWVAEALEPARGRLEDEAYERLVSALSVVVGWEAMTVLRDVRGLDQRHEADVLVWTARTLVEAALGAGS